MRPAPIPTLLQPQHLLNSTSPERAATLWHAYLDRTYMPRPLHYRTMQTGGKPRRVGIPHPIDAAMMTAWRKALDPRVDPHLCTQVWGYRRGRSREAAVRTLQGPLPRQAVLVRTDIRRMFESIPIQLMRDTRHMYHGDWWLVERWLLAWCPEGGLPTGASISPLLSNLALHFACDTSLRDTSKLVRYSDDFSLVTSATHADTWLTRLRHLLGRYHLTLHPEKTTITPLTEGTRVAVLGIPLMVRHGVLSGSSPSRVTQA